MKSGKKINQTEKVLYDQVLKERNQQIITLHKPDILEEKISSLSSTPDIKSNSYYELPNEILQKIFGKSNRELYKLININLNDLGYIFD